VERSIGTIRRELTGFWVVKNEEKLRPKLREYMDYYNHDRTHLALNKSTPVEQIECEDHATRQLKSVKEPVLGGIHNRYYWVAA
jgi:hypothetical protein